MTYIIPEIQQQTRSVQDKSSLIFNEKRRKALKYVIIFNVERVVVLAYLYFGEDKWAVTGFQLRLQSLKAQDFHAKGKKCF